MSKNVETIARFTPAEAEKAAGVWHHYKVEVPIRGFYRTALRAPDRHTALKNAIAELEYAAHVIREFGQDGVLVGVTEDLSRITVVVDNGED
jgi:hypothetical protein